MQTLPVVFAACVTGRGLPEAWCEDRPRAGAGRPPPLQFATKTELGAEIASAVIGAAVPSAFLAGGES